MSSREYGARTRAPAKARTSMPRVTRPGDPRGAAGVAVVEADHVEAALGEHPAELGVPPGHRAAEAHHQQQRLVRRGRRRSGSRARRRSRPGRTAPRRPPRAGRRRPVTRSRTWRRRDRPCRRVNRMVATRPRSTGSADVSRRRRRTVDERGHRPWARFLLPGGLRRARDAAAVLREGSVVTEAGRLRRASRFERRGAARRRRRTPDAQCRATEEPVCWSRVHGRRRAACAR